ncbi:unnamed protein product [Chilo suppressalis]|uniref:AB hydrolase-1 domain-containing protein n=1 Tax=Chilo suppressalis TaxID=168631 RepID=A0ABN8B263_CHISP|nr:hypothetical protein evm_012920 [Chilo suppressalis]CAH0401864.1 unnamed protein product [Chilo suppressalis]
MRLAFQCMLTPRLYKIYRDGPKESMYEPRGLEKWSDKVISTTNTLFNIGLYTSPFICLYVYRRGFFSSDEARFLMRCFWGLGSLFAFCYIARGIGRAANPRYVAFAKTLAMPSSERRNFLDSIRRYDFDFTYWPISYSVSSPSAVPWYRRRPFQHTANPDLPMYQRVGIQILAYIATHTFGIRLIYPGSLALINHLLSNELFKGRTYLVENFNGMRAKVQTADLNTIDTMFIDNRSKNPLKGKTLVICCEGNSGFYEIGIMTTPAKAGYSVLGWNHPGFAGSTGRPYPSQEHNAIDAIIQYAVTELNFKPEDIVMYGWSIGGYTAAWAAVNYPAVKGLVLDATFDDLLPLAENQMPASWSLLVKEVVRCYVDLNVAEWVIKYNGPVQLIRRTDDEIICLRPGQLASNRGNHLLVKIVEHRHRSINSNTRDALYRLVSLQDQQRASLNYTSVNEHELRALRLIGTYLHDFKSTHCVPLSEQHFEGVMEAITDMAKAKE